MSTFTGFPRGLLHFFAELEKNNSRSWFEKHRQVYENEVKKPMLAFVEAMQELLPQISPEYVADPRINGSVYRIYRDVRFSKNKMPYKTHTAAVFYHRYGKKHEYPGFYFQISHRGVMWGAGHFKIDPEQLAQIRRFLHRNPSMWKAIVQEKVFRETFGEVKGEKLKRPPKGFDPDHPVIEAIKLKQFLIMREEAAENYVETMAILDKTLEMYQKASPFVEMLCISLQIPF